MKKSSYILIAVIVVLATAAAVLAWLNWRSMAGREPATLVIKAGGEEVGSIALEEIEALGGEEFTAVLRSSGKAPEESVYTGLPLLQVVEAVQPGLIDADSVITVKALDGYAVTYSGEEMLRENHIYLVWLKDGKPLGSKSSGGMGPLLVIPRQHEFGQYWCKFAAEVDIR